jgi:SEC-C motif domain protein
MWCSVVFVIALVVGFASGFVPSARSGFIVASSLKMAGFGASSLKKAEMSKVPTDEGTPCACGSNKSYGACCKPFHDGQEVPPTPVDVVRSRFSALAYGLPLYMIQTTHPKHPEYIGDDRISKRKTWVKSLRAFSEEYDFEELIFDDGLEASALEISPDRMEIAFKARLKEKGAERTEEMVEKSIFERDTDSGMWLYRDAEITNPFKNKVDPTPVAKSQRMVTTAKRGVGGGN